ncbi:hypothetical protein YC2023_122121 [Brassica napus]
MGQIHSPRLTLLLILKQNIQAVSLKEFFAKASLEDCRLQVPFRTLLFETKMRPFRKTQPRFVYRAVPTRTIEPCVGVKIGHDEINV